MGLKFVMPLILKGSAFIVNFLNRFPVRARVLGVDHHGWVNHGEAFSVPRLGIMGKSETNGIIYTGDPKSEPVYEERGRWLTGKKRSVSLLCSQAG